MVASDNDRNEDLEGNEGFWFGGVWRCVCFTLSTPSTLDDRSIENLYLNLGFNARFTDASFRSCFVQQVATGSTRCHRYRTSLFISVSWMSAFRFFLSSACTFRGDRPWMLLAPQPFFNPRLYRAEAVEHVKARSIHALMADAFEQKHGHLDTPWQIESWITESNGLAFSGLIHPFVFSLSIDAIARPLLCNMYMIGKNLGRTMYLRRSLSVLSALRRNFPLWMQRVGIDLHDGKNRKHVLRFKVSTYAPQFGTTS